MATTPVTADHVDLVLVRHAHAGSKGQFPGDDRYRPLSRHGRDQADRIAAALEPLRPSRLVTSPLLRCIETLQPLAERLGVPVEERPALAPDGASGAASLCQELLAQHLTQRQSTHGPRAPWVICTHGEILSVVLPVVAGGVALPEQPPGAKGSMWLLDAEGPVPTLHYMHHP